MNGVEVHKRESYEFGEESSFIVMFSVAEARLG